MVTRYGQFCPVAKAAEILTERWTPLIVRELISGSRRFNELRRGVPLMSPSLLSTRLKRLEDEGIIQRSADAQGSCYQLTRAGEELSTVIEALGTWGKRWVRRGVGPDDLDAGLLMWDIHRRLHIDRFPVNRTTLLFHLTDAPSNYRYFWLIINNGEVDICLKDPGFDVDLHISVDLATMTAIWLGDMPLAQALRENTMVLDGPRALQDRFKSWLKLSHFADIEREAKS
jgi:DNA-binding HxlR family transcriptional regulator